jgi:hypothetical protein
MSSQRCGLGTCRGQEDHQTGPVEEGDGKKLWCLSCFTFTGGKNCPEPESEQKGGLDDEAAAGDARRRKKGEEKEDDAAVVTVEAKRKMRKMRRVQQKHRPEDERKSEMRRQQQRVEAKKEKDELPLAVAVVGVLVVEVVSFTNFKNESD